MADTVKVPGVGPVKKVYVIAGVSVLGGVLVYAYWKRARTPSEALTEATPDATATGAYDTASGYVADSTAAGYNTVYPSVYPGAFSQYGYDLYGNPLPPGTGAGGKGGPYTTNADWATAAESALQDGGITLATSTLAISRVLGGLQVTAAQRDIFMQSIGILGQPPQGYPQPIKLVDTPSMPAPPKGGALPAPSGLHVVGSTRTHVALAWSKVPGAVGYRVYRSDVSTNVGASTHEAFSVGGLRPNHTYHFHVRAMGADGNYGASSKSVSGRTRK